MKWIKDNGDKIETNDLAPTIEYCKNLGWTQEKKAAPKKKAVKKPAE